MSENSKKFKKRQNKLNRENAVPKDITNSQEVTSTVTPEAPMEAEEPPQNPEAPSIIVKEIDEPIAAAN